MADIFISYARSAEHEDRRVAQLLKSEFERLGLSVFIDVDGIEAGDEFNSIINEEAKTAGAIVGVWSAHAFSRPWLCRECRVGLKRKVLVPVLIEELESLAVPIEFEGVQYIEFFSQTEEQWESLIRSIARTLKRKDLVSRFVAADNASNVSPLVAESTTVESTNVRVVLDDLDREKIRVPDYQRDSNQWSYETKSLFIETVINNLAVPAFFFEPLIENGRKVDEVVDGQQRLTTLRDFRQGSLRLVSRDDAPYISPNSAHYAGRVFDELPDAFRDAFESYRLPIIKLHNLGDMRLEVFRRINQGGTPLSAQDIRLAYYGQNSPSVAFVRLAGIYDLERPSSQRFMKSARENFALDHPWQNDHALKAWALWWGEKETAKGQRPSEMFLWALTTVQVSDLDAVLKDREAMSMLRLQYGDSIDEALDVYCAQCQRDDTIAKQARRLMTVEAMQEKFFPYFEEFVDQLLRRKWLDIRKARVIATLIGSAFSAKIQLSKIPDEKWDRIIAFLEAQRSVAQSLKVTWPEPKGRWSGKTGARAQMEAARPLLVAILTRSSD